ncbi:MAG: hypothetical protein AB7G75_23865 [Candidatus Binatia bacterium]
MRTFLQYMGCLITALAGVSLLNTPALAEEEVKGLLDRLMAAPTVKAEEGFRAEMLIPPGEFYDPLWLHAQGDAVWLNDDGGEEGEKGSRLVSISKAGKISELVGLGRLLPVTGYGVAPESFGEFAGHIYSIAQAKVAAPGATANHVIQRVDPQSKDVATVVCTLTEAGNINKGVSGFGVDARFGPAGSPFADRFFAATAFNNTIYQVKADNTCSPFVTFDGAVTGAPMGIAFSPDGKSMLVTLKKGGILEPPTPGSGMVVRVSPDGKVDEKPVVQGLSQPMGIMVAPANFGAYGGQIFVADGQDIQAPVPMTQALNADGKVYRVGDDGKPQLVASGFFNPVGMLVVNGALWVTDINGDFIAGKRELPDGFIVKLTPTTTSK